MTTARKVYLGGLDWMVQTMWHATMRHTGGIGNAFQVVFQLDGVLNPDTFIPAVQRFAETLPVLQGQKSRDLFFRPFWKIPDETIDPGIRVEVHRKESELIFETLEHLVNTPFRSYNEHVVFHLIMTEDSSCWLAAVFDHRLMDARGAEQLMLLLNRYLTGEIDLDQADILPPPEQHRSSARIKENFLSARCIGQTINKSVIGSSMIRLDELGTFKGCGGRFLINILSEEETRSWIKRMECDAGYLMFMPYALAAASTAFRTIPSLQSRDGSFIIPCTADLRPQGLNWKNTFFNYCSIFFFKAESHAVRDRTKLISSFKTQFYNQAKAGFPSAFERFMAMMRRLPLPVFERMNSRNHASFSVGAVGKSVFDGEAFSGLPIRNLFHMPLLPPMVGLGFFFSQINGRLNLGITWREGIVDEQEVKAIEKALLEF